MAMGQTSSGLWMGNQQRQKKWAGRNWTLNPYYIIPWYIILYYIIMYNMLYNISYYHTWYPCNWIVCTGSAHSISGNTKSRQHKTCSEFTTATSTTVVQFCHFAGEKMGLNNDDRVGRAHLYWNHNRKSSLEAMGFSKKSKPKTMVVSIIFHYIQYIIYNI